MRHIKKYNEGKIELNYSKCKVSEDIIDIFEIFSNYSQALDINVFEVFSKINKMSPMDLEETYESLITNHRSSNSKEENFMIDVIEYLNKQ